MPTRSHLGRAASRAVTGGGASWPQLLSFPPDVPALQFTFLHCVVILATLISVLHFILTSKGNTLVKFHWNPGPFFRTTPSGLCFLAPPVHFGFCSRPGENSNLQILQNHQGPYRLCPVCPINAAEVLRRGLGFMWRP